MSVIPLYKLETRIFLNKGLEDRVEKHEENTLKWFTNRSKVKA